MTLVSQICIAATRRWPPLSPPVSCETSSPSATRLVRMRTTARAIDAERDQRVWRVIRRGLVTRTATRTAQAGGSMFSPPAARRSERSWTPLELISSAKHGCLGATGRRTGVTGGRIWVPACQSCTDPSRSAMPTVAELLVDALAEHGVTQVWGVVGDALNPVTDAIHREDRVEWVGVRHEEAAAFAASAQAQLTDRLAVCMGTVGPGAIHLLNGLYDAKK